MHTMRKLIPVAVVATAGIAVTAIPALAATKTVALKDDVFAPKSLSVKKGTTVKFVWRGRHPHNVFVTKGPAKFSSPVKTSGTFSRKLTKKGTYSIICSVHPATMKLKIKVS